MYFKLFKYILRCKCITDSLHIHNNNKHLYKSLGLYKPWWEPALNYPFWPHFQVLNTKPSSQSLITEIRELITIYIDFTKPRISPQSVIFFAASSPSPHRKRYQKKSSSILNVWSSVFSNSQFHKRLRDSLSSLLP